MFMPEEASWATTGKAVIADNAESKIKRTKFRYTNSSEISVVVSFAFGIILSEAGSDARLTVFADLDAERDKVGRMIWGKINARRDGARFRNVEQTLWRRHNW